MKKLSVLLLSLAFVFTALPGLATTGTINNDAWRMTTSGQPIYAQGGSMSYFNGLFYWYGVQYGGSSTYYSTGNANGDTSFVYITVYSSPDLINWTGYSPVVTTSTSGFSGTSWVGRVGRVLYNSSNKVYVMWVEYAGSAGSGMACLTSSSPTGPFTLHNVQTSIPNVYHNIQGDSSMFVDSANGSTPYFIFSDPHGREHAYISPLSSDYYTIEPATLISEWPQGQEANNMFERNGYYYYIMSNLAGWSYSSAYAIWSPSILTPSDYTADAPFAGTTATYTYYSQVSFAIGLTGSQTTSYIMAGDRWADFDSSYKNAGHGEGYNVWCPITFSGETPTFNATGTLTINSSTGVLTW